MPTKTEAATKNAENDRAARKAAILAGGDREPAEKVRDHIGELWYVLDCRDVQVGDRTSLIFSASKSDEGDGDEVEFWAPGLIASMLRDLKGDGFLPAWFVFTASKSKAGTTYYKLEDPSDDGAPDLSDTQTQDEIDLSGIAPEDGGNG